MRHAVSKQLYAYWRGLKTGGSPPERNAVEPGAIRSVLADTFVLDFESLDRFPLRICGSKVNAVFQRELRGVSFLEIWREADRGAVHSILEIAADEEAAILIVAEARPAGLEPVEIEVTLLPLRHQGLTHARMMGALAVRGGVPWLGLVGSAPVTVKGWRRIERDGAAATGSGRPGAGSSSASPAIHFEARGEASPVLDVVGRRPPQRLVRRGIERPRRLGGRADDQ